MRQALLCRVQLPLHPDSRPLLEPVRNPLDVGLFVELKGAQGVAGTAPLVEHDGVIPIVAVPLDQNGHLLAAPAALGAGWLVACESAYCEEIRYCGLACYVVWVVQ